MATTSTSVTGNQASSLGTGKTTSTSKSIANNFDQFLQLLTTQLKNQSPLDPLDTNQFTQQLVQFASVEQQLKTNDTLSAILGLNKATTVSNGLGFVGQTITADGTTTRLADGKANWGLDAPRAGTATISIKDKNGNVVATDRQTLTAGAQTYSWSGRTSTGGTAPPGDYTLSITGQDSGGQNMTVKTELRGVVTGVNFEGETPVLKIGDLAVPIDKVKTATKTAN
jgi:flagellar basal-body rod modification protein FlgD